MKSHQDWMQDALELAKRGRYEVSPNPMVGCCIVRANRFIASGFHRKYGGDHAEVEALKRAGRRAKGATLYVTLEPCSSWGKTSPCISKIVDSGIKNVVIATRDPNPVNRGKGIRALKKAGIQVIMDVLGKEARELNAAFFKYVDQKKPFVTLKMAQSLDGKIATVNGLSQWITSKSSRRWVHELRAEQDAILVGKNTWRVDNPSLNVRIAKRKKNNPKPWRIVLDPEFKISPRARVFKGDQHTLVVVDKNRLRQISKKKSRSVILLPVSVKKGKVNLQDLLSRLAEIGIMKLLVEGGGEVAWSFLKAKQVDRFLWFVAPKFLGGREAKTSVEGEGVGLPSQAMHCKNIRVHPVGSDWVFEGRMN